MLESIPKVTRTKDEQDKIDGRKKVKKQPNVFFASMEIKEVNGVAQLFTHTYKNPERQKIKQERKERKLLTKSKKDKVNA